MKRVIVAVLACVTIALLGGVAFIYSGIYDVSAADAYWPITRWAVETTRARSIEAHAAGIVAPQFLDDDRRIAVGVEHYADHCAVCHGAPGVAKGDIATGMYPPPPDLTHVSAQFTSAELFWILKHGIKMTGMPSWADHSDDELWDIVAFLEKLPAMSPNEYKRWVAVAASQTGHHMEGMSGMGNDDHDDKGDGAPAQPGPAE